MKGREGYGRRERKRTEPGRLCRVGSRRNKGNYETMLNISQSKKGSREESK